MAIFQNNNFENINFDTSISMFHYLFENSFSDLFSSAVLSLLMRFHGNIRPPKYCRRKYFSYQSICILQSHSTQSSLEPINGFPSLGFVFTVICVYHRQRD